jgi:hypothetical protein
VVVWFPRRRIPVGLDSIKWNLLGSKGHINSAASLA